MKITNKNNLPDAIVRAVSNDSYDRGECDFSVTELLTPPRVYALRKKHEELLTEDASDRVWSLLGQGVHAILERANVVDIAERRLKIKIGKYTISGGMDLVNLEDKTLYDYKVTSVVTIKMRDFDNWVFQLSAYAAILEANGEKVENLEVVAILRDWMSRDKDKVGYPPAPVHRVPVGRISTEKVLELMVAKAEALTAAVERVRSGSEPRHCSENERWANPKSYGKRCEGDWCRVSQWCSQYKAYLRDGE